MEVAVVADEVLGADGRFGIHRVRAEVLDGEDHVRAVRIDCSAAESAERLLLVAHSETVPARSDSAASSTSACRPHRLHFRDLSDAPDPRNHASSAWPLDPQLPGLDSNQQPFG